MSAPARAAYEPLLGYEGSMLGEAEGRPLSFRTTRILALWIAVAGIGCSAVGGHGGGHGQHAPLVHDFEDKSAAFWKGRLEGEERDAYQQPDRVVAAMEIRAGMSVADIGTGTGYFLGRLSEAAGDGGRVLAVDISPKMVRFTRERIAGENLDNVSPRLALTDDPLLDDASVDRILIVNTWHHIPEREAYAGKLAKTLKPGGRVFIVDFKKSSKHGPSADDKLAPERVAAELASVFSKVRVDEKLLSDQYIVVASEPQK